MATHTLLYHGHFNLNFRSLATYPDSYAEAGSAHRAKVGAATEKVYRRHFRYMRHTRSPEEDFVVGVDDLILTVPVLLAHERHMEGKQFCAESPVYFEDDSAMRLLVDMIVANPSHRDALGRLLVDLGRPR